MCMDDAAHDMREKRTRLRRRRVGERERGGKQCTLSSKGKETARLIRNLATDSQLLGAAPGASWLGGVGWDDGA